MMKKDQAGKEKIVLIFLISGLLVLGMAFFLSREKFQTSKKSETRLARVERESGKLSITRNGIPGAEPIESRGFIFNLDSIETSETGEANLFFENGYRVKILDNALVTIETNPSHSTLILKRGTIKVVANGEDGSLYIAKNGNRIEAAQYEKSELAATPVQINVSENEGAVGLITQNEIQTAINNAKPTFFQCYSQLLQKDIASKGRVTLAITIENTGKTSLYEVTQSPIKDKDFQKCLVDILKRMTFRHFRGDPISTSFQLDFD